MTLKIHPGIGIARIGDSDQFFIGPETVDVPSPPAGGYRDADCRIKRQAARYRVFQHTGTTFTPVIGAPGVAISWTVVLEGISATITGFETSVSLMSGLDQVGELRTDAEGNLLVLSCQVSPTASFDGNTDGPVTASVTTTLPDGSVSTEDANTSATSSWVAVVPPNFAPGNQPRLPYLFMLYDRLVSELRLDPPLAAAAVSFRREIFPAVRGRTELSGDALLVVPAADRAREVPFYSALFYGGTEGAYLHAVVAHYHSGTWNDTADTPTPLVPDELDRGPLCHVDGSCPGPGWELNLVNISASMHLMVMGEKLRLDRSVVLPGMSVRHLGWRRDLAWCTDMWAPAASPNPVAYGHDWRVRGFMVRSGDDVVYEDYCSHFELTTSSLDFGQVERGSGVARPIDLEMFNYYQPATVEFLALPPGVTVLATITTTGQVNEMGESRRYWVFFRAAQDAPTGLVPPGSVELQIDGQPPISIPIHAEIVAAESTQLGLVLDCSGSMTEDAGLGPTKFDVLKDAIHTLIITAREGDGIAVAPFSDNALGTHAAQALGDGSSTDDARNDVWSFVQRLSTHNLTSIGDGLVAARGVMATPEDPFVRQAMIVVTDGVETAPAYIDDVEDTLDDQTFAIGIGTSANINVDKLRELTHHRGGVLLLTGTTISGDNAYILDKFLLQILAGATNEEVVLDPTGTILPGTIERIAIPVTEADFRVDAIVVANQRDALIFGLLGPDGLVRTFQALAGEPGARVVIRDRVAMARLPTPFKMRDGRVWGPGTWHLLIAQRGRIPHEVSHDATHSHWQAAVAGKLPVAHNGKPVSFAAVVNARSSIRLTAHVAEPKTPGAKLALEAALTYAGVPLPGPARVEARVTPPDGPDIDVLLSLTSPGRYEGALSALKPGLYPTRIRATGRSPGGFRFIRELTCTPALSSSRDACADSCAELKRVLDKLTHRKPPRG